MKYNENAFDKIMESYDLDGIVTEKVVRSDAVKNAAFSQLGLGSKKKKSNKKVFRLIAAAAAAAIIGTSVIAANPIKDAFKGFIGIPDDVFVYAGDNVQVTSDKSNVELKGVVCEDTMLFATFEITKKDGTPFTDDLSKSYIRSANSKQSQKQAELFKAGGQKDNSLLISDDQQVFFKELAPNENDTQEEYEDKLIWMNGRISYDFKDKNTVKGFLEYTNSYPKYDFQGKTIELSEGKIYVYTRGECIYNYHEMNGTSKYNYEVYKSQSEKVVEKYTPLLAENQIIDYEVETESFYITTMTEVDVDYKISFDVNYTPQNLVVDMDINNDFDIADAKMSFDSIEITPFRATLKGIYLGEWNFSKISGGTLDEKNDVFYRYGGLDIVMKDGTVIRTDGMSLNSGRVDEKIKDLVEFEISYNKFGDDDLNFTAINPENIKALYLCGVKIYGEGSDTIEVVSRKRSEGWFWK